MAEAVEALRKALKKKVIDKFEVGDVIRWTASGRFTYCAIKTEAGWFTTAREYNRFVDGSYSDFADLVEVLARSEVTDVMVSTGWEEI
jgi:hypothetical protein